MRTWTGVTLAILLAVGAPAAAQAQTELTFSTWVAHNHPLNQYVFFKWAEAVEKETRGQVKIRTLPKPIAAPNQHYDAVIKGQVDLGFATYGYQPERFMPYLIAELPFLGETAIDTSVALWRTHKSHIEKIGIHKDVHVLGIMTHGPGYMHHATRPILKPEDLRGQKIRVGGDVPAAIVKHFGGVVITQPAPKSYEILSQGIADGIFFPTESLKSFNITKLVPHTTYVKGGTYSSSFWFAMNKARWEKLDKPIQDAITRVSGEAFAWLAGGGWDRADREGLAEAKANGNTFQEASPEFAAELRRLTAELETDYAAKLDRLGLDGKAVIKAFRAEVAKVAEERKKKGS
ncbi:MAG: TRAP transporter substrate-binding protein [Candidatus Rokuibacteriota bacterium]